MKYLCLLFFDEQKLVALSPNEGRVLAAESQAFDESLLQSGRLLAAEALESIQSATTLRMRNGKLSITDGPFAETNEQIGGFILIEAADLNDAMRVAAGIPVARFGGVEVRPCQDAGPGDMASR